MLTRLHGSRRPRKCLLSLTILGLLIVLIPFQLYAAGVSATYRLFLPGVYSTHLDDPWDPTYELGYGISTAVNNNAKVQDLGFGFVKLYDRWAAAEPTRGVYWWVANPGSSYGIKATAQDAVARGLRVIVRIDGAPDWEAAAGTSGYVRPPASVADFGNFMGAYAAFMKDLVAAYEIWQEPNMNYQWGNASPNPESYTALLKAAYPKIKASDPKATVIAAGLVSTAGDGGASALNDLDFIQRMYTAGVKGSFDAMGSHPYGTDIAPENRNPNGINDFRRAADQYAVMQSNGDGARKVWATDFGWLLNPSSYGHPEYLSDPAWANRQYVSPQTQADYLVRAYQYAYNNWPWMAGMVTFNMDMSTVGWYTGAQVERWYSILNEDSTPRTAYTALKAMSKPTRH